MKNKNPVWIIILLYCMTLSACNLPQKNQEPTQNPDAVFTAAALTVQAKLEENTPVPQIPTAIVPEQTTQVPVSTNTPAAIQPTIISPSASPTSNKCDVGKFVDDVTVPDDTAFLPGTSFTKTWRIKNEGTCTWTTSYAIVFENGDSMGGPASVALTGNVAPGQTIDISVPLKAPDSPETYKGNWKLRNSSGVIFGLGDDNKPFWVQIKVANPTSQPLAVTSATLEMIPAAYNGVCPFPITLRGKITANGPGEITYTFRREDGFVSPPFKITFDSAGEKSVPDYSMAMGVGPGFVWSGKVSIYIDSPNHQTFGEKTFTIQCIAP
ncbi:MAG: hypothetical protein CVU39_09525 [Chloroflexi bacterium HGW-Chloroflexi-10]|nr:MAG: hypothetical protein CVU39_09525 [Chloroflexi bacterium HGW-Chloroflexi-10]